MQTKTDDLILEIKKLQSVIIAASQALMNEKQQEKFIALIKKSGIFDLNNPEQ